MKIGVFVGSFDPIHNAHTNLVNYLIDKKIVDKVIIIATGNYWDKQNITDLNKRLDMLELIKNDNIIIDRKYNHYKYTYQILNDLSKYYNKDKLYLIIGSDNANTLYKWKNYEEILKYGIIVINRDNIKVNLSGNNIIMINKTFGSISSTQIRNIISTKKYELLEDKLDKKVINYIKNNRLYGD